MSQQVAKIEADLVSVPGSPGQKRKRDVDSPDGQRTKRTAPPAAMSAETASFIENAIEATHAATSGVSVADFSALQQAAAADHTEAPDPAQATSTAQAALGMYPTLHVPTSTEDQFAAQASPEADHGHQPQHHEHSYAGDVAQPESMMDGSSLSPHHAEAHDHQHQAMGQQQHSPMEQPQQLVPTAVPSQGQAQPSPQAANGVQASAHRYSTSPIAQHPKPSVGSEEWHKMRKDNHKEVERRRRETINEGINELAKIVPGCEKNKGSILQRAVSFITQLKENEQQNIEKWTLEKLLTEQAITELSASNDKLKQECERLYRELETWKRVAQNAGLEPPQPNKEETNLGTASS
ncbi:hypothetical protein CDD81_584 [Ophiocordyceps australis]|uniref:BHLH domain-containing protein n=1 Tax=Ophiocordyceps australis TaxID=1399860 RepID=A0A2C5XBF6_9HYPO|nr:hypothetical protein CDD81_584 [Ophiocordyceps australis]